MHKIACLPDNRQLSIEAGETILEASLRAGVPHAHACGGRARCSTCRIWVLEGLEHCSERSERERARQRGETRGYRRNRERREPQRLDADLLGDLYRVIDFDAEIPNRAFDFVCPSKS